MSNETRKPTVKEKARYLDLETNISKAFQEGNRNPEEILNIFQRIVGSKQPCIITVEFTEPTSLLDLRKKHGTGRNGFQKNNTSWLKEEFATEKIKGTFEVNLEDKLSSMTIEEQEKAIAEGFKLQHPTVLAAAYFKYLEETNKRPLDSSWMRTSATATELPVAIRSFQGGLNLTSGALSAISSNRYSV